MEEIGFYQIYFTCRKCSIRFTLCLPQTEKATELPVVIMALFEIWHFVWKLVACAPCALLLLLHGPRRTFRSVARPVISFSASVGKVEGLRLSNKARYYSLRSSDQQFIPKGLKGKDPVWLVYREPPYTIHYLKIF